MIYVSSACIKERSIAEVIKRFAQCGIKNIELSGGTDYYKSIEHDLVELADLYGLTYACHAYFPPPKVPFVVNLASCNDEIYQQSIAHYVQCIEMLKRIGCHVLSVHAGFLVEVQADEIGKVLSSKTIYDEGKAYDRFCSAYQQIERQCALCDIKLYLENNVLSMKNYISFGNHNYMMMTDYMSIMKMKKQMDFKLLLDLGHLHVSSHTLGLDYAKECALLRDHSHWFHLSENDGSSDEHSPLREGSRIMEEFCKINDQCNNITLETIGNMREILTSINLLKSLQGSI